MTARQEACPFCPPGVTQATFARGAGVLALCNLAPVLPGHSLIVPARHVERLLDLSDDELSALAGFGRRVTEFLMKVFGATGVDWTLQDGAEAGQTVRHLHLHLIPRIPGDLPAPGDWYQRLRQSEAEVTGSERRVRLEPDEMVAVVERLRRAAARVGLNPPGPPEDRPRSFS